MSPVMSTADHDEYLNWRYPVVERGVVFRWVNGQLVPLQPTSRGGARKATT